MIFAVPLIIEKIYRNRILPAFTKKWPIRQLYKVSFIRKTLNKVAGKKLLETFGGEIEFFGIGGAKLDRKVEQFLIEANFPYSIGYGLTETAPLLAGMKTYAFRLQSTGPAITGVELKINKPDQKTGEGEIWARGANVMKGYYKSLVVHQKGRLVALVHLNMEELQALPQRHEYVPMWEKSYNDDRKCNF